MNKMEYVTDIIKQSPGYCKQIFTFCCYGCLRITYGFEKNKRSAYKNVKIAGWISINRNKTWFCPMCTNSKVYTK